MTGVAVASVIIRGKATGRERTLEALPTSWCWATVGEIASVFRGASPRPKGDPRYFGGPIPWIMISDVNRQPGKYLFATIEGVTEAGAALSRRLHPGSLILSNSGTVCVPKILKVEGCIHDGFVSFDGMDRCVSLDFAYWWFEFVRPFIVQENRQGVTQVNLNTDIVRDIHIPIPPRREQDQIVEEIEKQFTRLDAAVAALRRVQANLNRYRAAVLKAACEGRLVPTEAELARREGRSYEPASVLLERIRSERRARWEVDHLAKFRTSGKLPKDDKWKEKYNEPERRDTTNLSNLPKGWTWATTSQIGEVQLGRQRSPKKRSKDYPTKYIRAANITEKGIDLGDVLDMEFDPEERRRYLLREGDIVLSEASGSPTQVGKPAVWQEELPGCCFQNTVIRLRPHIPMSEYLLIVFKSFYWNGLFARIAGGVGINHLGADKFSSVVVAVPPLSEQLRIVADVDRRLSVIEEIELQVEANLKRADRLRQAVLRRAFEGKLASQDPNEEPASMLLDRIQAARAVTPSSNNRNKKHGATASRKRPVSSESFLFR